MLTSTSFRWILLPNVLFAYLEILSVRSFWSSNLAKPKFLSDEFMKIMHIALRNETHASQRRKIRRREVRWTAS